MLTHLSSDQLLDKLVNAAALAGHHASRPFFEAERELYTDAHMREAQEIKRELLARLESHPREPEAPSRVSGSPLPDTGIDVSALGGKEF